MSFPEFDASDELFVSAKQVDKFMKDDVEVFMILASIKAKSKAATRELSVVCDFLEVFPDDASNLSQEREVEFTIDLVPSDISMLMAPYIMFTS